MIWEAAPGVETVRELRTLGIESVVFDPCGAAPVDGDYLSVMNENLEALRMVYVESESDLSSDSVRREP